MERIEKMNEMIYMMIMVITLSVIGSALSISKSNESKNSENIETELTIIDKETRTTPIYTGRAVVPVKHYELTVDFGGEEHTVSVGEDVYNTIEVGNSAMFICYYNSKQELVDICFGD